ncbi:MULTISPECIES: hypothetical protein [Methylomonas]|uniref:hypothetical protein n=1 Tax=Methylomonas TaxID=416 RepID=UPI001232377A|nr:hypothetical protein [Methylomonas rhizoryzae]
MAIQKEFVLRYRGSGHVRFQVPARATQANVVQLITDKLCGFDGVYQVKLFRRSAKLVIRYDEKRCNFIQLARQLSAALTDLEQQGWFDPRAVVQLQNKSRFNLKSKLKNSRVNRWLHAKIVAAQETAQAARVLGKIGTRGPKALFKDPEKAVIDFLNDILVLYLIKVHWNRITQQWLVKPIAHRYEWLATFYMFFLLVRSRRPK